MDYQFRRISESDLPAIKNLYAVSFEQEQSLEALANKFSTSRFGAEYIGYMAIAPSGEPAAFYGVFPVEMRIAGQVCIGAQSGDTMTHPAHRKQGLFVRLAEMTYQLAREQGIKIIFGFPNEQSYPGFQRKLGWSFLEPMQTAELRADRGLIKARFGTWVRGRKRNDERVTERLQSIIVDHNLLIFDAQGDGVLRDAKYLEYKHENSGSIVVQVAELTVWLVPGSRLDIGGFIEHQPMSTAGLEQTFQQLLSIAGARSARFTYSAQSAALDRIRSFCQMRPNARVGYRVLDASMNVDTLFFCRGDFDYF
jgi:GNAT superfamily N-acetyltransferase